MAASEWRVAFASVIGTSHLSSGLPCQDWAEVRFASSVEGETLVAVVSDGAGSASAAQVGAEVAAETLAELIVSHLEGGNRLADLTRVTVERWIGLVRDTLATRAADDQSAPAEYACTLLAAIIGEEVSAFLQIGDGAIVVSDGERESWSFVFWPQHGEFANITNFVTSANALEVFEFEVAPRRLDEFALFTDGLEHMLLLRSPRSVHQPFFDTMLMPVRASVADGVDAALSAGLAVYLRQPVICDRTDDDKTLILASRCTPTTALPQEVASHD